MNNSIFEEDSSPEVELPKGAEIWNTAWSTLGENHAQLFTRRTPRTIDEFWARCYFEDLWAFLGDEAATSSYAEFGAGRGTAAMYLADRKCSVTLIDYAPAGFKVAKRNFAREELAEPEMIRADVRRTGLPSNRFDCIYSVGLLEHFDDPWPVLLEALRLVRPGGSIFMIVMPTYSPRARVICELAFTPGLAPRLLLPAEIRRAAKRWLGIPVKPAASGVYRTGLGASDYIKMLASLDARDVRCCPYNPYHRIYSSRSGERFIEVPLYRGHRALKSRLVGFPSMKTWEWCAQCLLLTCRKSGFNLL